MHSPSVTHTSESGEGTRDELSGEMLAPGYHKAGHKLAFSLLCGNGRGSFLSLLSHTVLPLT